MLKTRGLRDFCGECFHRSSPFGKLEPAKGRDTELRSGSTIPFLISIYQTDMPRPVAKPRQGAGKWP
jgi:hypothetical protein